MATWSKQSKNTSSFSNQSKNSASWTKESRSDMVPAGKFDIAKFDQSKFDTAQPTGSNWIKQSKK